MTATLMLQHFLNAYAGQLQILGSMALAMVLGGLIGAERELADKPAGLRTHMLVAAAAALLVGLGDVVVERFEGSLAAGMVRSDPIRILQAIITGVSFLGAGTIIQRRGEKRVQGLTTAASVLLTAGIGVTVALAQYLLALGGTILTLVVLRTISLLERWLDGKRARLRHGDPGSRDPD